MTPAMLSHFNSYLHTLDPFAIQFTEEFGIRWYGLSYLSGFVLGYLVILWMIRRGHSSLTKVLAGDLVFAVAVGTIAGGRLGYCLLYSPDLFFEFSASFPYWGVLALNKGGMASHGGILGVVLGCAYFGWRNNISYLHLCDLSTLGGTLGIFFGRIANFINGELVGRPASEGFALAVKFPQDILLWPAYEPERINSLSTAVAQLGVQANTWEKIVSNFRNSRMAWQQLETVLVNLIHAVQNGNTAVQQALEPLLTPRHPSQLYASFFEGGLLFLILLWIWRIPRKPGVITGWFFVLYSIFRTLTELFRMPDAHLGFQALGLTRGQWLSVAMFVVSVLFLLYCQRRDASPIDTAERPTP